MVEARLLSRLRLSSMWWLFWSDLSKFMCTIACIALLVYKKSCQFESGECWGVLTNDSKYSQVAQFGLFYLTVFELEPFTPFGLATITAPEQDPLQHVCCVLVKSFSNLMAGILPFGAVFIELFFILSVSKRYSSRTYNNDLLLLKGHM